MSLSNINPVRSPATELQVYAARAVGGTTAVTKVSGEGVAFARTGTGAYTLTFSNAPGNIRAVQLSLQATTPGALAGHTVIPGAYNATTKVLAFVVYNAADAAHDLAALEWVNVCVFASQSNLGVV